MKLTRHKPLLIVVAGGPGSGKTSLARALAEKVRCPMLCRDEFKEGLVNTTRRRGKPTDKDAWHVYQAFFGTVDMLLKHQITLVAEAAYEHDLWAPKLNLLKDEATVRLIICTCDPGLARARYIERGWADPEREQFHTDPVVRASRRGKAMPIPKYDPPRMELPTLNVDTTKDYQPPLTQIVAFVRGR